MGVGTLLKYYLLRMSETDEQDFMADYLSWMKGPGLDLESLHVDNFGYDRPLTFSSISLTPDTTMRFNLQTSGMQTQSRWSTVVIGKKNLGRFGDMISVYFSQNWNFVFWDSNFL